MGAGNPYHSFFYPIHPKENHGYVATQHTHTIDTDFGKRQKWERVIAKIAATAVKLGMDEDGSWDSRMKDTRIAYTSEFLKVLTGEDQNGRVVLGLLPGQDYEEFMDANEYYDDATDEQNAEYATYLGKYCEAATAYIQALRKNLSKTQELRTTVGGYQSALVPTYVKGETTPEGAIFIPQGFGWD